MKEETMNSDRVWDAIFFPTLEKQVLRFIIKTFPEEFDFYGALQFILDKGESIQENQAAFEENIKNIALELVDRENVQFNTLILKGNTPLHFACGFHPEVHGKVIGELARLQHNNINAQNEEILPLWIYYI